MRDYQKSKNNPYYLRRTLYRRMLLLVRDYNAMKTEWEGILEESPAPSDGMPRGSGTSDPTLTAAVRRERLGEQIKAVDNALAAIPPEYQKGIWWHAAQGAYFPEVAALSTWKRWNARFLFEIAKNLGEI